MGISQALYTGVTGLGANADGMSVVANNIANASANGYKKDRAEFEDLLSTNIGSATQIGRGARLGETKTLHTQGGLTVTDNITDLAIQGEGFFVVNKYPGLQAEGPNGTFYTRVGSLHFDNEGYIATNSSGRVQGYMADNKGNLSPLLTDIRVETNNIPPAPTEKINLNVQLDSREPNWEVDFDPTRPGETSTFNTAFTIYDSHGFAHQASVFFRKMAGGEEGTEWEYFACVANSEVTDPDDGDFKVVGGGKLNFNREGLLLGEDIEALTINFNKGAFQDQKIEMDFGRNVGDEEGKGINASTAIAGDSITIYHQQDGYESGQLRSLSIGLDGKLTGVFTNGVQRTLASIALATFTNQDGLIKSGQNEFISSLASGAPYIGPAQTGVRGSLYSSALEESNVDLAHEFVTMIRTQRLFQANSRSITTADTLIEEVINLKR